MRGRTFGGRPTPQPPTNPPEQQPTSGEHDIWMEDAVYDHDGPSVTQQERHDSPILNVVREHARCTRDGCDAALTVDYIYTMDGMSDRLEAAVRRAANVERWGDDAYGEYVAQNVTIVDYDESPVLAVEFGDDTFGYWYPTTTDTGSDASGPCYGHVDEATRLGI